MKYQEFVNSELNRKRYWARSVVGKKKKSFELNSILLLLLLFLFFCD